MNREDKIVVELWEHETDDFLALIVIHPTGVVYTNQVGGTHCAQPEVEGFLIPLSVSAARAIPTNKAGLFDEWHGHSSHCDLSSADKLLRITQFLEAAHLDHLFESPQDSLPLLALGEAWVPVVIKGELNGCYKSLLQGSAGKLGYLTWSNSD